MGMTYEQFWEQDSWLVKYWRRAYEIRQDENNRQAWLQGMYIYEAIADISPILHPFAKKGTKARPYAKKPYEFSKPEKPTGGLGLNAADKAAKAKADKIKARMVAQMNQINAAHAKKRIEAALKEKEEAGKALMEGAETTPTEANGPE